MDGHTRAELGVLASITAAIEATSTEVTDIEIEMTEQVCRGNVCLSIPLTDVKQLENVQVNTNSSQVAENTLQIDLDIGIDLTEAVVDTSTPDDRTPQTESTVEESTAPPTNLEKTVPPYRDPEKLAAVYNESATFREMKTALDTDVTAQTVRKYMIKYGIHEPEPRPDQLLESIRVSEFELMSADDTDRIQNQADDSNTDSAQ